MLDDSRLVGPDEIGDDGHDGIDADPVHLLREMNGALGDVVRGRDDDEKVPFRALLRDLDEALSLVEREARIFTGRPAQHDAVHTRIELALEEPDESAFVDRAVRSKRCYQSRKRAPKHRRCLVANRRLRLRPAA